MDNAPHGKVGYSVSKRDGRSLWKACVQTSANHSCVFLSAFLDGIGQLGKIDELCLATSGYKNVIRHMVAVYFLDQSLIKNNKCFVLMLQLRMLPLEKK